jgi:hypothetical protein
MVAFVCLLKQMDALDGDAYLEENLSVVGPTGQSSNPLCGNLSLAMAFVEVAKRGRVSVSP